MVPQPTTAAFAVGAAKALTEIGTDTGVEAHPTLFQEIVTRPFPDLNP